MPQSPKQVPDKDDPLDGYRGRPSLEDYDKLEEEVRAFRELGETDIDLSLLGQVLKKDNLLKELNNESSVLKRLATHAYKVLDSASDRWVLESDANSVEAISAHGDARAARLVIDWIAEQIEIGNQAERQLEVEEHG